MPAIETGEIVGDKFRVGRVLGRGGMSVVYEAQHVLLGHRVAVKVLGTLRPAAQGAFERALVEAQASARLTSEHAVRVFDVGTTRAGHAYVVMEKLIGNDLAQELRKGPVPIAEAVKMVLQACHALAEAHALGIVHRDIKPSNLFLALQPDHTVMVKVLDFGLALADSASASASTTASLSRIAGSPGYACPEQLATASDVDARADVWGLGITLYELVTGRGPYEAANLADALIKALTVPMPPMMSAHGRVPRDFEIIVRRCLEKDRENRFASVLELAEALGPFAPRAFAHYPERIREIAGRGLRGLGTMRITLPAGQGATATFSDTGSSDGEPHTETGVSHPSPLVVASVVPAHRAGLRLVLATVAVAGLLLVLFAGRGLRNAPPTLVGASLGGRPPPSSSVLGPLPPLAVLTSATGAPTIEPISAPPSAVDPIPSARAGVAVRGATRPAPPKAPPKTSAAVGAAKANVGNPLTYR